MKKMLEGISSLMLVMALFMGCGSKKEPSMGIVFTPLKSYVNQTVHIKAQNEDGLSDAYLIYPKGTMIPMKKTNNNLWELDFALPEGMIGKIALEIVGKPADGSPAITQSFDYEIMEYPTINAKVLSENPDGAEVEVKTSKPFKKVYIQVDENKQISLENKGDNKYTLKTKELDLENKQHEAVLEDEYGNSFKKNIIYIPEGTLVSYGLKGHSNEGDSFTYQVFKTDIDIYSEIPYKNITVRKPKDDHMDKLSKNSKSRDSFTLRLESLSPSKNFLFLHFLRSIYFDDKFIDSSGEILEHIIATYAAVYNLDNGEYKILGEPNYYKKYKNPRSWWVFSEEGPLYYFIRWENSNLILLDQRKNPKINFGGNDTQHDYYSTLATAKIVNYSIFNAELKESKLLPATPFLSFSDQYTGIQGWGLPHQKIGLISTMLPSHDKRSPEVSTIIVTVLGNENKYDLRKLIPEKVRNYPLNYLGIKYVGTEDDKPFVIIMATYEIVADGELCEYIVNSYKLYPLTGEFVELCSYQRDDSYKDSRYSKQLPEDCLKDYCLHYMLKDGKVISKQKCGKYINYVGQIINIY